MVFMKACAIAAIAGWLLAAAPCTAAPADTVETLYALNTPNSVLEVGCQGPCACPLVSLPTYGSFVLMRTGVDPLFTHYAVKRFIASFNNGPGVVSIIGSGHYRIGGEFALVQELTLDLQIQGQPAVHFASGLSPVRAPFPQIDIACAVNDFFCFDSVLVVDAKPVDPLTVPGASPRAVGLVGVGPNPCFGSARIEFAIDRPGPVDLSILDCAGRHVRTLANGVFNGPGPRSLTWEGRRDDGRAAPAGVYWALMRWPDGVDRRRFVKLE
jgi:hypothetical protein